MMHKATQMMLAIVLALSSGLSAAEATHHKRSRHVATRHPASKDACVHFGNAASQTVPDTRYGNG